MRSQPKLIKTLRKNSCEINLLHVRKRFSFFFFNDNNNNNCPYNCRIITRTLGNKTTSITEITTDIVQLKLKSP